MAINPAQFGMPDATTAGVQAGVTLTNYTGPMTITTAGAVLENVIIHGQLTVKAANVTIRNCIIQSDGWWGIEGENSANLRVEHSDIIGGNLTNSGILGSGTFVGNDIRHTSIGIQLTDGASTVSSNYIHDLFYGSADPHYDGITLLGRQNHVVIDHNTISVPSSGGTASILISDTFGPVNDVNIHHNLMYGDPSYTVYFTNSTNIVFTDNYVERGYYGYYVIENANPTMSGNVQWQEGVNPTPYPNGPVDHSPNAVNDVVSTGYNTALTFDALTNDSLGDTPTVVSAYDAATGNGGTVSYAASKFTYTPATNWSGTDTFHYTIRDADGDVDSATVSVTVGAAPPPPPPVDHFPNAVNDVVSTNYNTALTFDALTNDSLGDTPTVVSAYDAATGNGGTVSYAASKFTYTPATNWSGTDTFHYTIRDADGDVDSATVSVTVGAAPPPPPPPPPTGVTLTGTLGGNTLTGGNGNDTLDGRDGWDWLSGGAGNDRIIGGNGNDDLFGGAGADVFDYNAISETPPGGGQRDFIHDFQVGVDKIDLSTIDARAGGSQNQDFIFLGEGTFGSDSAQPRLLKYHYEIDGDGHYNTIVEGTTNTQAGVDFQISLLGQHALTAGDFVL